MKVWEQRFNESTRGRVIALLRRGTRTVDEMANALGITDNAVRAQLAALERDGLVRQHGLRRGAGKPSFSYALAPEFEPLLSSAYIPLLVRLLRALNERLSQAEIAQLLRSVGRRWAAELRAPPGDVRARTVAASALLNELGGVTEVEEHEGRPVIRGYSCPLNLAVKENPRMCLALETLLSELIGKPVRECCERDGEKARCCFEVGAEAAKRGGR
ncbi:MAG TPA: helix-turn-helix domain-containing protein [Gemmatimonadales bacterium]